MKWYFYILIHKNLDAFKIGIAAPPLSRRINVHMKNWSLSQKHFLFCTASREEVQKIERTFKSLLANFSLADSLPSKDGYTEFYALKSFRSFIQTLRFYFPHLHFRNQKTYQESVLPKPAARSSQSRERKKQIAAIGTKNLEQMVTAGIIRYQKLIEELQSSAEKIRLTPSDRGYLIEFTLKKDCISETEFKNLADLYFRRGRFRVNTLQHQGGINFVNKCSYDSGHFKVTVTSCFKKSSRYSDRLVSWDNFKDILFPDSRRHTS